MIMNKPQFTPAPWEWYTSNSFLRLGSGREYKETMYACRLSDGCATIEFRNQADKSLIAAAPELYEALVQILGWRELRSSNEFPIERVEGIAREALAKARGDDN
jgi:hypothetical protein